MFRRQPNRLRDLASVQPPAPPTRRTVRRLLSRACGAALGIGDGYGVERLEKRMLLTTVDSIGATGSMLFYTGQNQVAQITYSDVDFEAIAAFVDPTTGAATLGDPVLATTPEPALGGNIYKIYVTESNADSYITIETLNNLDKQVPTPFAGGIPDFAGVNAQNGQTIAIGTVAGTGGILMGALDPITKPVANTPITSIPLPLDPVTGTYHFGLQPDTPTHTLNPGIQVIATNPDTGTQNNFGEFFVGGTVTGSVNFGGNLNEFYAGQVFTGDFGGDLALPLTTTTVTTSTGTFTTTTTGPTSKRTVPDNFHVAGDLREFLTSGPVGTNAVLTKVNDPTSIQYNSSFDLSVGGKLGEVHIANAFAGTIEAGNSPYVSGQLSYPAGITPVLGNFTDQTEVESVPPDPQLDLNFTGGGLDPASGLTIPPEIDSPLFANDTPDTAQILGSIPEVSPLTGLPIKDADGNIIYIASVDGVLDNIPPAADQQDNYAVAMLAGITFDVQLSVTDPVLTSDQVTTEAQLQVVDPDGRVIATNYLSGGTQLQITTDRPGLYRFTVNVAKTANVQLLTALDYNLTITNVGNLGIGAIHVAQDYSDIGVDSGIIVGNGDLGVLDVGDTYVSTTQGPTPTTPGTTTPTTVTLPVYAPTSILVAQGNLRVLTAVSIGSLIDGSLVYGPTLSVPNGSVGLIRANGTGGTNILDVMSQYDPNYLDLATPQYKTDDQYASAIGGFIQEIDAATDLYAELATNAGIGTIHAGAMNTSSPSHIDVNADNKGNDGIIDLIDVTGEFGVLGGGPEFVTNNGGNIRYMQIGGPVFLPTAFGGVQDEPVTYAVGATATFTDDSGAVYSVTPVGLTATTQVTNASTGAITNVSTGTSITAMTYPVLDKGGQVPLTISATNSNGGSGSIIINASSLNGPGASVDVGSITISGVGRPITAVTANSSTGVVTTPTDANGNSSIEQAVPTGGDPGIPTDGLTTDPTDEFLSITGPTKFNVLNVVATTTVAGNSPVEISNTTRGEVVNLTAPGLGQLIVDGNLGFATPVATPAAVMPRAIIANGDTYPFVQQHTGVVIGTGFLAAGSSAGTTGDVVSIQVGGAVGNVQAGGTIQSLIANSAQSLGYKGATAIPGQFDGIVGPILGTRLLYIDIGQGLLPSGTGGVGLAGIYATGKVGTVTNLGNNDADIRGDIISAEDDSSEIGIDAITLGNGSIIGSKIYTVADATGQIPQFNEASDLFQGTLVVTTNATNFGPGSGPYTYDIGPITVSGLGGILGSDIVAGAIAQVTVNQGGFGVLTTEIRGLASGRSGGVTASGYGIRDSEIVGFGYVGPIIASGNGGLVPTTAYPLDIRPSDVPNTVDPYFGVTPNAAIDLNGVLGTTAAAPNIANVTDTGVIQDDVINGENDFAGIIAQKARTALPVDSPNVTLPTPTVANIPVIGTTFDNSVTFGGVVGGIQIRQATDGFQITAGGLLGLNLSSSVNRVGISVAGAIKALVVRGNFGNFITDPGTGQIVPDSYINAGGPNGTIGVLRVLGNLNANVYATGEIGSILVTGDLLGSVSAYGLHNGLALGSLHVLGGVRDGSLVLNGSVGSIIVNGTFGTATGALTISGNANLIEVGAGRVDKNADLALALTVTGTLKSLKVIGQITGSVHTGVDLTRLAVTGTGVTPNIVTGNFNVGGRLGTASIINGNVDSDIIVTGEVSSFVINRGSLAESGSLQSLLNSIVSFKTTGGAASGMYGSLIALNGTRQNIDISGNVGDGVNPATISAFSGNSFHIRGNIANNANIGLSSVLNLLRVDGSVLTGATVSAHPLKVEKIAGVNDGTITVT
jgi:hypothetical protein